ncbi:MAG TPA: preprotein translocase subunit SecE, partial [Acidobacteriota bacterium]|nr:preprotein translocase subunit SecE [Acidobacteriota bacterium]
NRMLGVRIPPGLPLSYSMDIQELIMERTGNLMVAGKIGQGIEKVKDVFVRIRTFFSEVIAEAKKVTWPTFKEVRDTTIVVIIAIFIFGIFLYLVDMGLGEILRLLFRKVKG